LWRNKRAYGGTRIIAQQHALSGGSVATNCNARGMKKHQR